jgi:hypothetical protein
VEFKVWYNIQTFWLREYQSPDNFSVIEWFSEKNVLTISN